MRIILVISTALVVTSGLKTFHTLLRDFQALPGHMRPVQLLLVEDTIMEGTTMEDQSMVDTTTMVDTTMEDTTMEDTIMEDQSMVDMDLPIVEGQNVDQEV